MRRNLLIVQVTPIDVGAAAEVRARNRQARIEQIQFNATLNSELEALKYGKMIGATEKLRRLRIGRISADEQFEGLADESAATSTGSFLERLHRGGRAAADLWLKQDIPRRRDGSV